jgi:hypothetical protein
VGAIRATTCLSLRAQCRGAVVPSDRLPLRVAPAPGEAIDSWLEVTARYMALPLRAVARALDLPIATRPTWIGWLSRDQLNVIQAATGVSTSDVEALTLSVYDGIALQLDPNSHRLDGSFRSELCPGRASARNAYANPRGRWQLAWRLGWSFACVAHNCVLADARRGQSPARSAAVVCLAWGSSRRVSRVVGARHGRPVHTLPRTPCRDQRCRA